MKKLTTIRLHALACLAIGIGTSTQLLAQTVTLNSTADTYVQSGMPTTSYATDTLLLARSADAEGLTRASFIQFSLSTVPAGTITSARLRLYGRHEAPSGTGWPISVWPGTLTTTWAGANVNYNNSSQVTGVDFFNTTSIATTNVAITAAYHEWDVTSYVNSRRSIGHATLGIAVNSPHQYRVSFNSADNAANRPQLVVTVGPPGVSQNWPMFGKDYDNTRASTDTTISSANVSRLGVVRQTTDGGVTGTPTIVDGIVYWSDFSGYVKAMRVSDQVVIWRVRPQTTMLSPSPFVSADSVYVAGNNGWVYALNRSNGTERWRRQIELTQNSRVSSSPIVVGNLLIIGSGSYQVFVPGSTMFRGSVVFLDTATGNILRRTSVCPTSTCGGGVSVWSTAAVDTTNRTAYIGTGQAYLAPAGLYSDALVAINIDTGVIRWRHQFVANDVYQLPSRISGPDEDVGAAPNLFISNGRRAVGVGGKDGTYRTFDRETGAELWRANVGIGSEIGGVMQSTAYGNGRIYVMSNTSTEWPGGGNGRNNAIPATGIAYALNANTGAILWQRPLDRTQGGGFGGIAYANELMYNSTWDGRLRVFNAATGAIVREVQASPARGAYIPAPTDGFPNGSASAPAIYQGRVYMGYGWTWVLNISGGIATMGLL